MTTRALLALVAAVSVCLSPGCRRGSRPATARKVLLITIDTMRWDRLGAVGENDVPTPNLDRLASAGALFTNAVTAAPQTLPSHASIFTGRYPPGHGARNNGIFRLPDDVETLSEVLSDAGFETAAFVGSFVLDGRFGLVQGFDTYDDELPDEHPTHKVYYPERRAEEVVNRATAWIRGKAEAPFFVWVHVFDPHAPYQPPPPFDETYRDRLYDGEIAYTDHSLGPLLELVGGMDDSLVIVTADHGESLGEHGESTHGLYVYDSTVRVPLLMKGVGIPAGVRVDAQVRTVDVAPTVLELADLRFGDTVDGESLLVTLGHDPEPAARRTAYSESFIPRFNFNWSELRSLRTDGHKFIQAPRPELYDLRVDPGEASNLWADAPPPDGRRLASELAALASEDGKLTPTVTLDAETARRLESLGYITGTVSRADDPRDRPDPKDRVEVYERMQELLSAELSPEETIAGYRRILADEPGNTMARNRLANTLSEEKRLEEAVVEYRRLVSDSEIDFAGLENLASALLLLGRIDEALDVTELAVAEAPWNPDFQTLRGEALERAQRFEEARAAYDAALELERSPDSYWRRGALADKLGDTAAAERDLRAALAEDETFESALAALARLLIERGRSEEARALLDKASSELDRSTPTMKAAWAEVALASGNLDEARALLEEARAEAPDNTRVLALLGPIYAREGKLDEASRFLETALSLGENAPEIRRNLALIHLRQGRVDRAIAELVLTAEAFPRDASVWYTLGNAYHESGRHGAAADAFEKALASRPRWPEAAFNLGMAADSAGRSDDAVEAFRLFLDAGDPSDARRREEARKRLTRLTGGR